MRFRIFIPSYLYNLARLLTQPVVNNLTGDRQLLGYLGQIVLGEPLSCGKFFLLELNLSRHIVGMKTYHQTTGIGPGLTAEVAQVGDGESCLLQHLAMYGFLK